jgi:hypothetical protein
MSVRILFRGFERSLTKNQEDQSREKTLVTHFCSVVEFSSVGDILVIICWIAGRRWLKKWLK